MALFCAECLRLLDGCSISAPHHLLFTRGSTPVYANDDESKGEIIGSYHHFRCGACGSLWMQRTGRWGELHGFRLQPAASLPKSLAYARHPAALKNPAPVLLK